MLFSLPSLLCTAALNQDGKVQVATDQWISYTLVSLLLAESHSNSVMRIWLNCSCTFKTCLSFVFVRPFVKNDF